MKLTLQLGRSGLSTGGGINAGFAFGIPPVIKFASRELQERVLPDLLLGKKRACIAITEPDAGSDVAGITTTAVKSEDRQHYIINGAKKWYVARLFRGPSDRIGLQTGSGRTWQRWPFAPAAPAPAVSP